MRTKSWLKKRYQGLKNFTGGAEPESSSPMIGAKRKRPNAGGGFGSFIGFQQAIVPLCIHAGPGGFEPLVSGSEGRRLNPDWATGPKRDREMVIKEFLSSSETTKTRIGYYSFVLNCSE